MYILHLLLKPFFLLPAECSSQHIKCPSYVCVCVGVNTHMMCIVYNTLVNFDMLASMCFYETLLV